MDTNKTVEIIKSILLWMLLVWFIVVNVLVICPSVQLLRLHLNTSVRNCKLDTLPKVPETLKVCDLDPKLDSGTQAKMLKNTEYKVLAYTQEVTAYTQHLTAYKAYIEVEKSNSDFFVYEKVVKDVLSTLLNSVIITFLGFAGIRATGVMVHSYLDSKQGKKAGDFRIF